MSIASSTVIGPYKGFQVTLTTANTNYGLADLLAAIDSTTKQLAREVLIQSDFGNLAAIISVGDVNMSSTRYGYQMNTGDSRTYVMRAQGVDLTDFYLRTTVNGSKVNIELVDF